MPENITDLDSYRIKTVLIGEKGYRRDYISCDPRAALLMRIHENGDVDSISMTGEEMDKLCQAWLEYRQALKI